VQVRDFAPLDTEAARALITRSGVEYVGVSLLVDQLADAVRDGLEPLARWCRHLSCGTDAEWRVARRIARLRAPALSGAHHWAT
jgi:hypothetical protein